MATPTTDEKPTADEKPKVTVSLKQVGAAPALKKKKFLVEGDRTIAWIIQWLSKQLRCEENETVFLYIQQAFAPSPDMTIQNMYTCYGVQDKLILYYCKTPAWG